MCINLEQFEKKDECPSLIISKLLFPKEVATETSRKSSFRTPFGNQRVNGFKHRWKKQGTTISLFSPWISDKLSWKNTALLCS